MRPKRIALVIAISVGYVLLCLALVYPPASAIAVARLPSWVAVVGVTIVGPPMFFVWGYEFWWVVVGAATLSGLCGGLGGFRRHRHQEFAGVSAIAAAAIWAGSAWLAIAMGI